MSRAVNKLYAMKMYVAYPNEMLNKTLVDGYFKNLTIYRDNFLKNKLRVNSWDDQYKTGLLRETVDPDDWKEFTTVSKYQVVKCFLKI